MVSLRMCLREGQPLYRRAKRGEKDFLTPPKQDTREGAAAQPLDLMLLLFLVTVYTALLEDFFLLTR